MLNTVMTILCYVLLALWAVSWTNFLHPTLNWWGAIHYFGNL